MRRTFILICFSFIVAGIASAQEKHCCEGTCTEEFAAFGSDENFVKSHPQPGSFKLTNGKGEMITFNTPDGKTGNAYLLKADKETNKYLFVIHEWYGLNDYIKQEAENLQSELGNINVLALDLYDGKVAKNNEEASKYVQSVETDRALNIIKGAIDYAGANAEVGTIGWCFGGGWSLQAGILLGDMGKATVIYYGMPEKDTTKLGKLKAPVLGIFGSQDKWITTEVVSSFEANMKNLGKEVVIKSYDADHAFANPSNPKHNKEAAEDARKITIEFLKTKLGL